MAKRTKDQQRDVLRRRFLRRRLFGHSLAWWKMWTLRSVCGFPLLLGVAWIILTHSPVTSRILLPRIGDSLGVDLSARRVVIGIRGNVVMEGVQARVPGIDHAAATFCQVERIDAEVDWGTIFTIGRPAIRQILLTDPLVRISQSMDDEALNVAPLRIVSSAGGPLERPSTRSSSSASTTSTTTRRSSDCSLRASCRRPGERFARRSRSIFTSPDRPCRIGETPRGCA